MAFIQIQEDKSVLKLFDQQAVQPNRSNGTVFLSLHTIGYTVFLILYLMKLTQIHEDSNIYVEERRIIKSVVRACDVTQDSLPSRQCVGHVRETNRVPFSCTVRKKMFLPSILSSCSNLAGFQCETKLCRYALKMKEGIWMRRHALLHGLLHGGWDLNEPWLVCDLTLALKCFSHWLLC